MKALHRYFAGINSAREHALCYGDVYSGTHSIDEHAIPELKRRVARGAGCPCKLDMKWNSRMPATLRHAHGFVMGVINEKTGNYWGMQAEEID